MPKCQECGSHVSDQFAKVFGNNKNEVYGCLDCGINSSSNRHKEELDHTKAIDL